jgi:DNA-binding XRE family transcriptional regulator
MTAHPNRSKQNRNVAANPKPAEIRRAREDAGLTMEQAAELVHGNVRSWQNWEAEAKETENARRMHPATWELFQVKLAARKLIAAGELTAADLRRLGLHLPAQS